MSNLRKLEEKDRNQVIKLLNQLTGAQTGLNIEELLTDKAVTCIVIEENDELAGFAALVQYYLPEAGKVGKIEDVIVGEKFRGRGFSRTLTEELIKIAKENNLKKIISTSSPRREAARKLYQSVGFEIKDTNVFVLNL